MKPQTIRINPDVRTEVLSPMSRINFAKVYTIEHNVKVRNIGVVHPNSSADLNSLFWIVQLENAQRGTSAGSSSLISRMLQVVTQQPASIQATMQAQNQVRVGETVTPDASSRSGQSHRDSVLSAGSRGSYRRYSLAASDTRRPSYSRYSRDGNDGEEVVEYRES